MFKTSLIFTLNFKLVWRRQKGLRPLTFFFKLYNTILYLTLCEFSKTKLYSLWLTPSLSLTNTSTKTQPTQSRVSVHHHDHDHHQRSSITQKVPNFQFHWFIHLHCVLNKSKWSQSPKQTCVVELTMAELRAPEPIGFKKETGCSVYCQSPVIVPHPFSHYFIFYGKDSLCRICDFYFCWRCYDIWEMYSYWFIFLFWCEVWHIYVKGCKFKIWVFVIVGLV